jgi:dTDP-4-dehydrorhamnose reductase
MRIGSYYVFDLYSHEAISFNHFKEAKSFPIISYIKNKKQLEVLTQAYRMGHILIRSATILEANYLKNIIEKHGNHSAELRGMDYAEPA